MNNDSQVNEHYGAGGIMEKILAGLATAGKDLNALSVEDVAPVDEFHTRGREATLEVAALTDFKSDDIVLDVGCGLGGTARFLADRYQCHVTGIDITEEYIAAGNELNRMVGLENLVTLQQGSALELPYEDNTFDVVWTQHVQMNIEDKNRFYSEIARTLKPGGRLLFHDIFRGTGATPDYPVPWAEDASISFLTTEADMQDAMKAAGLATDSWHSKVDESLEFFERVFAQIDAGGPPPVGIHLLMRGTARQKLGNYATSLKEGRLTVALGLAVKS